MSSTAHSRYNSKNNKPMLWQQDNACPLTLSKSPVNRYSSLIQTHERVGQWVWNLKSNAKLGSGIHGNLLYASPSRFIASLIKGVLANIHSLKRHWLRSDFLWGWHLGWFATVFSYKKPELRCSNYLCEMELGFRYPMNRESTYDENFESRQKPSTSSKVYLEML